MSFLKMEKEAGIFESAKLSNISIFVCDTCEIFRQTFMRVFACLYLHVRAHKRIYKYLYHYMNLLITKNPQDVFFGKNIYFWQHFRGKF